MCVLLLYDAVRQWLLPSFFSLKLGRWGAGSVVGVATGAEARVVLQASNG